ncbi:MAG: HAMP domain-containing protein [Sulfuricella sp.]|nr:HAMP domain-containing protein [Sulfuricella sp.]
MVSIRSKILFGYYALALGVVAFALFAYGDLRFLEQRVEEGATISAFQEDALEMRRHEKNFFLYRSAADLETAHALAGSLLERLERNRDTFAALARTAHLAELREVLTRYRALTNTLKDRPEPASVELEGQIRSAGRDLSSRAETLAVRERAAVTAAVQQSQRTLFLSMGVLVLIGILGGQALSRAVVRPLRQLEIALQPIAEGRFRTFPKVSADREIVSLTLALNRMLEELETRQRQILQSDKLVSLGVLASGVAHEINNPLGNISTSCQILMEEENLDVDARREWLAQIDSETRRAQRIVRTLLDYARRRAFHTEPVALRELLEKCLLLMRGQLPGAHTVQLDVPADILVCADDQRLQQVFINLFKNALDAGGKDVHISVAAYRAMPGEWPPSPDACVVGEPPGDGGRPAILVSVGDDGPGISADVLNKIFDPFFTTRAPGHGTGLGLYVVEEIVQEHGGCIAVESRPGAGARFTIRLPAG